MRRLCVMVHFSGIYFPPLVLNKSPTEAFAHHFLAKIREEELHYDHMMKYRSHCCFQSNLRGSFFSGSLHESPFEPVLSHIWIYILSCQQMLFITWKSINIQSEVQDKKYIYKFSSTP